MMETRPSPMEMKVLYRLSSQLRKLAPWEWMDDSDVFGVQDVRTGETGYCSVLGALEEMFAVVVYMGGEGLRMYQDMQSGKIEPDDPDAMFMQDCLMVSFENKKDMDKDDIRLIKKLNLNFGGRNAWPMFKRYRPGFFPWHPDRDEVLLLTDVLEQTIDVCQRLLEDDDLMTPTDDGLYLVRVPVSEDGKTVWKDEWRGPAPVKDISVAGVPEEVDELRIQRIKKAARQTDMTWEIDFFYSPMPVSEGERPYYPYVIMIADHETAFVYDVYLSQHTGHEKAFMEHFLLCLENLGQLPKEIMVRKEETAKFFGACSSALQIKISVVKKLDAVDSARKAMTDHLR